MTNIHASKLIFFKQLMKGPLGRYLAIGIAVYALEVVILILAQQAGASAVLAVSLSFWIGLALSFVLQKIVAFGDRRSHHKIVLPQLFKFSLLVLWNYGFTILATSLLDDLLPLIIIRTISLAITTFWNFYIYKTRIFKA